MASGKPSRTSARARKPVNYLAAADENSVDDDDFARPSSGLPQLKKQCLEARSTSVKVVLTKSTENDAASKKTKASLSSERKPLREKVFERDLELALELSKQITSESMIDMEKNKQTDTDKEKQMDSDMSIVMRTSVAEDRTRDYTVDTHDRAPAEPLAYHESTESRRNTESDDSESEASAHDADDDDDDDDDDDESDDDYDDKKRKTSVSRKVNDKKEKNVERTVDKKTNVTSKKTSSAPKTAVKRNTSSSSIKSTPSSSHSFSSSVSTSSSSLGSPHGQLLSPSTGLRLGLSRNVHIKPLHRNIHAK